MKPVKVQGVVTAFKGDGRKLGYPTANLTSQTDLVDGVYFGYADLAHFSHHPALIFVGTPTTLGETERRVESHLLDIPDKDYYGQSLKLSIRHYHRPNRTFEDVSSLVAVMQDDEAAARQWFKLPNA